MLCLIPRLPSQSPATKAPKAAPTAPEKPKKKAIEAFEFVNNTVPGEKKGLSALCLISFSRFAVVFIPFVIYCQ